MSFLIVKEIDGAGDMELGSRIDRHDAVTEALNASQQDENLGSVIAVVDIGTGACARIRSERKLLDSESEFAVDTTLSKLNKEIARAKIE